MSSTPICSRSSDLDECRAAICMGIADPKAEVQHRRVCTIATIRAAVRLNTALWERAAQRLA
jgi:hypothetical protein